MKLTKLEVHAILMGVSEFTFANVMIKNTGRIHIFPSIRSSPNIPILDGQMSRLLAGLGDTANP